ncbi:hydroxyisourate hydrolase [Gynuella sp.]|uniref:hydroxyisourate hydrolase n=1 Tax=Gynuella sp. TaxID=2969146 RepID=UPI003D11D286
MSSLSTHILDTTAGIPAAGVELTLLRSEGNTVLAKGATNEDGRFSDWHLDALPPGDYCLRFDVADYLTTKYGRSFFPHVDIHFCIDEERHYHVPLLISPYGYSTYRGS